MQQEKLAAVADCDASVVKGAGASQWVEPGGVQVEERGGGERQTPLVGSGPGGIVIPIPRPIFEKAEAHGHYEIKCLAPRDPDQVKRILKYFAENEHLRLHIDPYTEIARRLGIRQEEKWADEIENLWTIQGKNYNLDNFWAGSAFTSSPFVGLISSVGYSSISTADVAAQINGTNAWKEGSDSTNTPPYSQSTRPALAFNAASAGSKATSSASVFSILTPGGIVKGCFSISNSTKAGTSGNLITAGLFSGGDKSTGAGDTLNISFSTSL